MEAALKTRSKSQLHERLSNMLQINIEKQMEKIEKKFILFLLQWAPRLHLLDYSGQSGVL